MKKIILIITAGVSFLGVVFLSLGFYYSNQLIHPPKDFSEDIFKEWGVKGGTPESYGLNYEDVTLKTKDRILLKGWYIKAKRGFPDEDKAVILVHGYGTSKIRMLKYVSFLQKAGYNILLFDLRAHGDSEGKACSFGYYEQNDVEAAVNFLSNKKGIRKIGILGESLGGAVSLLVMEKDKRIEAGVFDSIFCDARSELLYCGRKLRHLPLLLINLAIFLTEKRMNFNMDDVNVLNKIRDVSPRAVFFIHAKGDPLVKAENSCLLYKHADNPKYIWLTGDNGHARSFIKYSKEYRKKVVYFFKKYLR